MKKTFLFFLIFSFLLVSITQYSFSQLKADNIFFKDQSIWAHRGLSIEDKKYSIKSFIRVVERGFHGVEIDVFFNNKNSNFIVSHELGTQENLLLKDVILTLPVDMNIWLDFKNLKSSNRQNALARLNTIISNERKSALIIESKNWYDLKFFKENGYFTSFWLNFSNKSRIYWFRLQFLKLIMLLNNFTSYSLSHKRYDSSLKKILKNSNILLFTVNSESTFQKLSKVQNIKVILTDSLSPKLAK